MFKYGCDVHMFDPTIPISIVENNLQDRLQFHDIGVLDSKTVRVL